MPGFRTHYIFGRRQLKETDTIYAPIRNWPHSYDLGQQGPDIFFYSPPSHIFYREHLGAIMHGNDTMAFFSALLDGRDRFITKDARSICDAYIMGFIGHYTLDTTVHPYVHYRTRKIKNIDRFYYSYGIHVLLETDIDAALLDRFLHKKPSEFSCAQTIKISKKEQAVISLLMSFAIRRTYPGLFTSPWHVSLAISCMRNACRLMHDVTGRRKSLVRMLDERLTGNAFFSSLIATDNHHTYEDPCNLRHRKWHNPWDESIISTDSVYDLMKKAGDSFRHRISLYRDAATRLSDNYFYCKNALLSDLGNASYDTGLEAEQYSCDKG